MVVQIKFTRGFIGVTLSGRGLSAYVLRFLYKCDCNQTSSLNLHKVKMSKTYFFSPVIPELCALELRVKAAAGTKFKLI